MKTTKVFNRLINNKKRINIFYGGSSSSKTISVLQYLTLYAFKYPNKRITLSSESTPKMKITIIRDWIEIVMKDLFDQKSFNKTDGVYKFPNGSTFTFVGADNPERFKGPRQHIMYFDEVNHIQEEIFNQADIRTDEMVFVSFNPASKFWIEKYWDNEDTYVDHSTYKDNPFISDDIIKALKKRELTDPNFYNVYTLGNWGNLEGLIFKEGVNWHLTNIFPEDFKKEKYGLDFGFSIDPSAIVHLRYHDGDIYVKEILYQKGLLNSELAEYLTDIQTVADSAEPKSIEEIKRLGKDIIPAMKGPDSIRNGIKKIKEFNIYITRDSLNLIKEFRNYKYATNKDGENLNKPIDDWNHGIDAIRYALQDMMGEKIVFFC